MYKYNLMVIPSKQYMNSGAHALCRSFDAWNYFWEIGDLNKIPRKPSDFWHDMNVKKKRCLGTVDTKLETESSEEGAELAEDTWMSHGAYYGSNKH